MPRQLCCIALDLETTGVDVNEDEVIEIGAAGALVTIEDSAFVGTPTVRSFSTLVTTKRPISEFVQNLTNLAPAAVRAAPPFVDALSTFGAFVDEVRQDCDLVLVTYNGLGFDLPLLAKQMAANRIQVDKWFRGHKVVSHVDLLLHVRAHFSFAKFKLGYVYQQIFQKEFGNAHRADADAAATLELFLRLYRDTHCLPSWLATLQVVQRDLAVKPEQLHGYKRKLSTTVVKQSTRSLSMAPVLPLHDLDVPLTPAQIADLQNRKRLKR